MQASGRFYVTCWKQEASACAPPPRAHPCFSSVHCVACCVMCVLRRRASTLQRHRLTIPPTHLRDSQCTRPVHARASATPSHAPHDDPSHTCARFPRHAPRACTRPCHTFARSS
eukprot:363553-Chlamydomonas_euryale.AAC.5